jgi:hypothetical protein
MSEGRLPKGAALTGLVAGFASGLGWCTGAHISGGSYYPQFLISELPIYGVAVAIAAALIYVAFAMLFKLSRRFAFGSPIRVRTLIAAAAVQLASSIAGSVLAHSSTFDLIGDMVIQLIIVAALLFTPGFFAALALTRNATRSA